MPVAPYLPTERLRIARPDGLGEAWAEFRVWPGLLCVEDDNPAHAPAVFVDRIVLDDGAPVPMTAAVREALRWAIQASDPRFDVIPAWVISPPN
jgi:hypothetical protein